MNKAKALYIHIPFCSSICSYCDFYKMVAKESTISKYIEYLVREMDMKKHMFSDLETIFIGGGTPTAINLNLLEYLLFHLQKRVDFSKIVEFTIEANPNNINLELIKLLKKYQVNRVSLGVQSFNDDKLKIMKREHREADVQKAMTLLKTNGFENINVDIIYAVGNDSFKLVKSDLKKAIKFGATHLSAYSLIIEEKTLMKKWVDEGTYKVIDGDLESSIYYKIINFLKKCGFIHYEVSNFAKKNHESLHNLTYWNNMNYVGLGANASYYLDSIRYTNINNLEKYYEGIDAKSLNFREVTVLSVQDQMNEEMISGLRKIKGVDLKIFQEKFKQDAFVVFPIIKNLIKLKLLKLDDNSLFIPENKLYLSNEVLVNFV